MREGRRILLLGATGFLGAPIRTALAADGRAGELLHVARGVPAGPDAIALDLAEAGPRQWGELIALAQPDVVVNAVGRMTGPAADLQALNVTAVEQLLEALARRAPAARLVQLGSAAEYGPAVPGRPTVETDEPRPGGPYGETKLAATLAVLDAARRGTDAVVLRVFNPVGPAMPAHTMPGAAARRMADALAAGEGRLLLGPLDAHRDFVATADVASAVVAAAFADDVRGEILNVGSGHARLARDLVRTLAAVAGYAGVIDEEADGSGRSGAVSWSEADLGRITKVLDWRPSVPFDHAVAAIWPPPAGTP